MRCLCIAVFHFLLLLQRSSNRSSFFMLFPKLVCCWLLFSLAIAFQLCPEDTAAIYPNSIIYRCHCYFFKCTVWLRKMHFKYSLVLIENNSCNRALYTHNTSGKYKKKDEIQQCRFFTVLLKRLGYLYHLECSQELICQNFSQWRENDGKWGNSVALTSTYPDSLTTNNIVHCWASFDDQQKRKASAERGLSRDLCVLAQNMKWWRNGRKNLHCFTAVC